MTDYPLGWIREEENVSYLRNEGLKFKPQLTFAAPEEFDTRSIINVENQGGTSSCVGHATSSCMEACAYIAAANTNNQQPDQFSRWYAYLSAQEAGGMLGRDNGATMSGAAKAMKSKGCCKESTLPFTGRYFTKIPSAAHTEASKFKIQSHTSLTNYQSVFDFIAGGFGGVIIGIAWTSRLANSNGVFELNDVKGGGGGHALLLWGYSRRVDSQGRKYIWLHNSHSKSWGNGGRAEVAPDVIEWWGQSRSNEMIGLSDLTGFDKQRRIVPQITDVM